jgi:hypothetical protein
VWAAVSVGVNEGDWIEYKCTYTGSPPDNYPKLVRIDVNSIEGTTITVDFFEDELDGKNGTITDSFDLEHGAPSLFLIPANLEDGDEFDHSDYGTMMISGSDDCDCLGARRAVVSATFSGIDFQWDRTTGVLLEAYQDKGEFTQRMVIDTTNMWQAQTLGLDQTLLYVLLIALIVIAAIAVIFLIRRKTRSETVATT